MFMIPGKYGIAKVFTNKLENETYNQILLLLNQPFVEGSQVRIMPDCHKGTGCVIGFTANLGNKVVPNLVGVDIGCGMLVVELQRREIRYSILDEIVHEYIPSGRESRTQPLVKFPLLDKLLCSGKLKDSGRFNAQIGTLGGGNHFIEVDEDSRTGNQYLVIHSGSRNLGLQVANIYQNKAIEVCKGLGDLQEQEKELIFHLKEENRQKDIQRCLGELRQQFDYAKPKYPEELCFLEGEDRADYLNDMIISQKYATLNRLTIAKEIIEKYFGEPMGHFEYWQSIHNYIGKDGIIRKGAVSAYKGERIIIPMNMRDGSLICIGKGNPDWNFSAPHGAGRILSRSKANAELNLEKFKASMDGIFTTSVSQHTLDESPMAYKPMTEILDNIGETVEIPVLIKPRYNFKAEG